MQAIPRWSQQDSKVPWQVKVLASPEFSQSLEPTTLCSDLHTCTMVPTRVHTKQIINTKTSERLFALILRPLPVPVLTSNSVDCFLYFLPQIFYRVHGHVKHSTCTCYLYPCAQTSTPINIFSNKPSVQPGLPELCVALHPCDLWPVLRDQSLFCLRATDPTFWG